MGTVDVLYRSPFKATAHVGPGNLFVEVDEAVGTRMHAGKPIAIPA